MSEEGARSRDRVTRRWPEVTRKGEVGDGGSGGDERFASCVRGTVHRRAPPSRGPSSGGRGRLWRGPERAPTPRPRARFRDRLLLRQCPSARPAGLEPATRGLEVAGERSAPGSSASQPLGIVQGRESGGVQRSQALAPFRSPFGPMVVQGAGALGPRLSVVARSLDRLMTVRHVAEQVGVGDGDAGIAEGRVPAHAPICTQTPRSVRTRTHSRATTAQQRHGTTTPRTEKTYFSLAPSRGSRLRAEQLLAEQPHLGSAAAAGYLEAVPERYELPQQDRPTPAPRRLSRRMERQPNTLPMDKARPGYHPKPPKDACAHLRCGALGIDGTRVDDDLRTTVVGVDQHPIGGGTARAHGVPAATADGNVVSLSCTWDFGIAPEIAAFGGNNILIVGASAGYSDASVRNLDWPAKWREPVGLSAQ